MTNIKVLESAINLAHARKDGVVIENKVYTIHDLVDILVKDLKRLEMLEEERANYSWELDIRNTLIQENKDLKQALNIISTKYVNAYTIRYKTKSYEEYNFLVNGDLTKEEYDLLKEVLNNDK